MQANLPPPLPLSPPPSPVEVGDELVLLVSHTRPEVSHTKVRLLTVPQVTL